MNTSIIRIVTVLLVSGSLISRADEPAADAVVSAGVSEIVDNIVEVNVLMHSAVGVAGGRPQQYDNFVLLKSVASRDELIRLTDHFNPVVRCYAFWALISDPSVDLYPLVLAHISDSELFETFSGCIRSGERVGDFFIDAASWEEAAVKLTTEQLDELDHLLITTPNDLSAKNSAIGKLEPTEEVYPRILELVTEETNQTALVVLAKYRKQKDIPVILNFPAEEYNSYVYAAISTFPDEAFWPLLESRLKEAFSKTLHCNEWAGLYKAIAAYKNDQAVELLWRPLTEVNDRSMREYHLRYLCGALSENLCPLYEELLWRLWEEEGLISLGAFRYLCGKDKDEAYTFAKEKLRHAEELSNHVELVEEMLNMLLKWDKEFAFRMIREQIRDADARLFPVFAEQVIALQDSSFIYPLANRLGQEKEPQVYLKIAEALLAYNNKAVNQKIRDAVKRNEALRSGAGNDALKKLAEKIGSEKDD
ncbi:MAG: hypothetical protein JXR23_08785 [Pontiellaceae bacterium]|nr:hypothetical protein [Pontiellaceae bacterium]